jgi:4-amino-4-deoxy-L-arabinose transferase-like glycosyltransferase
VQNFSPLSEQRPSEWGLSRIAVVVISLGFLLRLYSFLGTPVINADATYYVQQAKAIHYGFHDRILSCYGYLSNYPILIALAYKIFGDWVIAAKGVSLLFGTITLVPLYWLVRRFFDEKISAVALLVFAVCPPFVEASREVIRGPVYWFFAVLGLCLFVLQIEKRKDSYLFLSSLSFILAAWARAEATLFILVSAAFLLLMKQDGRCRRFLSFLLPVFLVSLCAIVLCLVWRYDVTEVLGLHRVMARVTGVIDSYQSLRQNLGSLVDQTPAGFSPYFFPKVRNLIWVIALAALLAQIIEAFFPPFFVLFLLGLLGATNRIGKDRRLAYLSLLSAAALMLLYVQILYNWAMSSRFVALFLFPAFVFMGLGVDKMVCFFNKRLRTKHASVYRIVWLLVLLVALPKNLGSHDRVDKVVFKEIGEFISTYKGHEGEISIAGTFKELRLVHFYAHINDLKAPCFNQRSIFDERKKMTLRGLRDKGFDYFIWQTKPPPMGGEKLREAAGITAVKLKEWESAKLGRLILFKINSSR